MIGHDPQASIFQPEAERAIILGSLSGDGDSLYAATYAIEHLGSHEFSDGDARAIFAAMEALFTEQTEPNQATVLAKMRELGTYTTERSNLVLEATMEAASTVGTLVHTVHRSYLLRCRRTIGSLIAAGDTTPGLAEHLQLLDAELRGELADGPAPMHLVIRRSREDLRHVPPIEWKRRNRIRANALRVLYGPTNSGKSTVAVNDALELAADSEHVLYIPTEDVAVIAALVDAWEVAHPTADTSTFTYLEMPNGCNLLSDAFRDALNAELEIRPATHIVIDTMRQAIAGDENSSETGAELTAVCNWLIAKFNASVDIVHHAGKNGSPRGTGAVVDNAAIVFEINHDDTTGITTITNTKMRGAAKVAPTYWVRQVIETETLDTDGYPVTSIVLLPTADSGKRTKIAPTAERVLLALRDQGGSVPSWAAVSAVTGVIKPHAIRALRQLVDAGLVEHTHKGAPYTLVPAGEKYLAGISGANIGTNHFSALESPSTSGTTSTNSAPVPVPSTTPLLRGGTLVPSADTRVAVDTSVEESDRNGSHDSAPSMPHVAPPPNWVIETVTSRGGDRYMCRTWNHKTKQHRDPAGAIAEAWAFNDRQEGVA